MSPSGSKSCYDSNPNGESSRQPTSGSNYSHGQNHGPPSRDSSINSNSSPMSGSNGESSNNPSHSPNSSLLSSGQDVQTSTTAAITAPDRVTDPGPTQANYHMPDPQWANIDARALVIKNIPAGLSEDEFRLLLANEDIPRAWAVDFLRTRHTGRSKIAFSNYHTEEDATAALLFLRNYRIGNHGLFVERKTLPRDVRAANDLYLQNQHERQQAAVRQGNGNAFENQMQQSAYLEQLEIARYHQRLRDFEAIQQEQIEMERQRVVEEELRYQQEVEAVAERRARVLQRSQEMIQTALERNRETLKMYQDQQQNDALLAKKKKEQAARDKEQEQRIKKLQQDAAVARSYKTQYMQSMQQHFQQQAAEFEKYMEEATNSKVENVEGRHPKPSESRRAADFNWDALAKMDPYSVAFKSEPSTLVRYAWDRAIFRTELKAFRYYFD